MFNQKMPGTGKYFKGWRFQMHTVFDSSWQAGKMDIVVIIDSDGIDKSHTSTFSLSLELYSVWVHDMTLGGHDTWGLLSPRQYGVKVFLTLNHSKIIHFVTNFLLFLISSLSMKQLGLLYILEYPSLHSQGSEIWRRFPKPFGCLHVMIARDSPALVSDLPGSQCTLAAVLSFKNCPAHISICQGLCIATSAIPHLDWESDPTDLICSLLVQFYAQNGKWSQS